MNLENIILSERNQEVKATRYMIPLIYNVQSKWVHRDGKQISGYQGMEEWRVTA